MTKTITINEKQMYEDILAKLDDKYDLVYIDYRDEIPVKLIDRCLKEKNFQPLYEEDIYSESRRYAAVSVLDNLLGNGDYTPDQVDLFKETNEYQELLIEVESRDISTPERDLFKRCETPAYIRFQSNYDCWLPLWEQGGIRAQETALSGIMAALSLNPRKVKEAAIRKGITCIGPFQNASSREGKELVDYDKFIRVLCETPNYGNWAFFGKLSGSELLDAHLDVKSMIIPEGTTCAMFNWWNGGGSLDFCETLRPVPVKELIRRMEPYSDTLKLIVDDKSVHEYGYCPSDVYGGTISDDTLLLTYSSLL